MSNVTGDGQIDQGAPVGTIFLSIGTDHHTFDRIVDWLDAWLEQNPSYMPKTLLQHGQTRPSRYARNEPFLQYDELLSTMASATVVVVHGGPATIMESRSQGRIPVCVPRMPEHGEVVDHHQQRFAQRLAERELLFLAETEMQFTAHIDAILRQPESGKSPIDGSRGRQAAKNLDAILSSLKKPEGPRPLETLIKKFHR